MAVLHGNIKKLAGLAALFLACLLAVGWGYTQVRAAADDRAEYRIVNDEYSQVLAPADPEAGLDQTLQLKAGEPLYGVRLLFATYGPAGGHRRLQPDRTAGQYILRAGV